MKLFQRSVILALMAAATVQPASAFTIENTDNKLTVIMLQTDKYRKTVRLNPGEKQEIQEKIVLVGVRFDPPAPVDPEKNYIIKDQKLVALEPEKKPEEKKEEPVNPLQSLLPKTVQPGAPAPNFR